MFRKISAVVLFVHDLDLCAAFYRDTLGLEVVFTDDDSVAFGMDDHDFALVKMAAAGDMVGEALLLPAGETRQRIMLCADVDSVDAVYQSLTAKGVSFIKPPADQPWGIRAAYFADPEGNLWELRYRYPSA